MPSLSAFRSYERLSEDEKDFIEELLDEHGYDDALALRVVNELGISRSDGKILANYSVTTESGNIPRKDISVQFTTYVLSYDELNLQSRT